MTSWRDNLPSRLKGLLDKNTRLFDPKFSGMWELMPKTCISLARQINRCKRQNWDIFYIVYSHEVRKGKSTLNQIIMLLNRLFTADRVVYRPGDFYKMTGNARPGLLEPIAVDEPDMLWEHVQSKKHKRLIKTINRLGDRNMMIGLCTSDLSFIPPYIMYKRTRAIFYVMDRGVFSVIPKKRIRNSVKNMGKEGYRIHPTNLIENWDKNDYLHPEFVKIREKIDKIKLQYSKEEDLKSAKHCSAFELAASKVFNFFQMSRSKIRRSLLERSKVPVEYKQDRGRHPAAFFTNKGDLRRFVDFLFSKRKITSGFYYSAIDKWGLD